MCVPGVKTAKELSYLYLVIISLADMNKYKQW